MATAHGGGRRLTYLKGKARALLESTTDQILAYIKTGDINHSAVYAKACLNLGSGIDLAIAMNEVPSSSHLQHLPGIVREVVSRKTELLQPPLMVLMLSIKCACRIGWFPDNDKGDLLMFAKEVGYGFYDTDKMCIEPSHAPASVSNIISRYYPKMKLESMLVSFDVKPGYGVYVADFPLSRGMLPPHSGNLWLLVARMGSMDTSACITSPPDVDFLINGRGVLGRTKSDMGKGPQLPSNITIMIKYGVNMLQAVGDFDGEYIIVIAFMSLLSSPRHPQLQDYVHPVSRGVDSDCDVIEMPSQISLNCPIGQDRIRTPVKGHLCKHPQCFDYKNFLEINSRRPTWRCPHCSQSVCHSDLRIDQKIVKVLNEAGEDVSGLVMSADGSWKVVTETNSSTLNDQGSVRRRCVPAIRTNHAYDAENHVSIEDNYTFQNSSSAVHISGLASTGAISSVRLQQLNDFRSQTQGITMVPTPPSMQQFRHHLNPTQTAPTWAKPHQHQPPAQGDGTGHANVGSTEQTQTRPVFTPAQLTPPLTLPTRHANVGLTEQSQTRPLFTPPATCSRRSLPTGHANIGSTEQTQTGPSFAPVQLIPPVASSPRSLPTSHAKVGPTERSQTRPLFTPPAASSPRSLPTGHANVGSTEQSQTRPLFAPVQPTPPVANSPRSLPTAIEQLRRGVEQPPHSGPSQPQQGQGQSQSQSQTAAQQTQDVGGDARRMRGSLRGNDLEKARLHFLAPPKQPARANGPWSRPTLTLPIPVVLQRPGTLPNSHNTPEGSK